MSAPRVLAQALGGPPLTVAALAGAVPDDWYTPRPRSAAEWKAYLDAVRRDFASADWLGALAPALPPEGEALKRLARSAGGRGAVVVSGQQPGLFGGPLYTWFKALSALALADALQAVTEIPVAPVFWAATDDADFSEASAAHLAVGGQVERLAIAPPPGPVPSLREAPLGVVEPLVDALERGAGAAVYPDVLRLVRFAYRTGGTVGEAYVTLLRSLLGPLGIAVLDAGHPAVRQAARPVLAAALSESASLERALEVRDFEIRERGFKPKVQLVKGLSLVFTARAAERRRIPIGEPAAAALRDAGAELGPNVLLRPVVERSVLPSASYVAGPAEIAYFAQASTVAAILARPLQVVVPRWAGVIVEPHVLRILERLGLEIDELRDPHAAERRLAQERVPDGIARALSDARTTVRGALDTVGAELRVEVQPLLADAVVSGARRDIDHRLDRLERRVLAAAKRRHADVIRDVATARASLFPLGEPQERVLNAIPLLARHGPPLVGALLGAIREHAVALSAQSADGTLRHDRGADVPPPPRPTESAID